MTRAKASSQREAARKVGASFEHIGEELANILRALAPSDDVLTHFRAARVEVLKGLRAVIDAQIEQATKDKRKGRSVPID